jgi:hypothetical protein
MHDVLFDHQDDVDEASLVRYVHEILKGPLVGRAQRVRARLAAR